MRVSQQFPSKYLKPEDFKRGRTVTMDGYQIETFQDGNRPMLYLVGYDKGLLLNKGNAEAIAAIYGDEMDDWTGKKIIISSQMKNIAGTNKLVFVMLAPMADDDPGARRSDRETTVDEYDQRPISQRAAPQRPASAGPGRAGGYASDPGMRQSMQPDARQDPRGNPRRQETQDLDDEIPF